jgi:aspartyl-tRNA(Asn)/glutamyl-tRNA(Gln) amidotransferase subunit C
MHMATIDKDTVKHVALLSRLCLDDKETEVYSAQLASIVTYISKLNELDTKDTLPTSHAVSSLKNVFRKDVVRSSLAPDEALANAPSSEDGFFKVPQVIEGK